MKTVLVTGAGGHLGRRITRRLAADGIAVRALARRPLAKWPDGVTQVIADLARDHDAVHAAADGTDAIIHLAGASDTELRAGPTGPFADSVRAAEAVAACNAHRVVYVSTVHVYGENLNPGTVVTESTPTAPITEYARARLACEDVLRTTRYQQPTIIFRLTNGIGAPVDPDRSGWQVVSNDLCRGGATEGRLVLQSSGEQWRDFVPLVDVESALSKIITNDAPVTGTYNFGAGESISVRALAEEIRDTFARIEKAPPTLEMPSTTGQAPDAYRIDVSALRSLALFTPTPRRDALEQVVRECLDRRVSLRER
jgi:UDP-glucose 4-epimerase